MLKAMSLSLVLIFSLTDLSSQKESNHPTNSLANQSWLTGGAHSPNENLQSSAPLPHPNVREADILWEKRIWRVVDSREKINLPFRHPEKGLFKVIQEGLASGNLNAYSPENDYFSTLLTKEELDAKMSSSDTITVMDLNLDQFVTQVVNNVFDPDQIKFWHIQEVWYFDSRHSNMQVRIIGIAPMLEKQSEHENTVLYQTPMFWINYEQARPWLAQNTVIQYGNDHSRMSWEDLFAMRHFSSHVYKENNMTGQRIQDYANGRDQILAAEKIEQKIQNFEQDVWSY